MSFQRTPPHKYPATHLIFVKNVPQESCSSVASLYTQYRPLRIKNLYPSSQITTLMIALPTADIAASALHRTDGLKFDNMVLSVERYNAKQSTVARRDTRRLRDGGADAGDERFGADEREEDEVPEGWEDEGKTLVDDEAVVEPKAGNVRVTVHSARGGCKDNEVKDGMELIWMFSH
ncbi:hypothetical protein N0V95_005841 [Ascochyta clinopodiicola]|nr:hypothetical protein N0V95_005841 [Ascochyta clinopodiicola]